MSNTPTRMRAKMAVVSISQHKNADGNVHSETVAFQCVCKDGPYGSDGVDEDNDFSRWSPSGQCSIQIVNPALVGAFKPGERYYLNFELANAAPTA